jgi:hypothetical protein
MFKKIKCLKLMVYKAIDQKEIECFENDAISGTGAFTLKW